MTGRARDRIRFIALHSFRPPAKLRVYGRIMHLLGIGSRGPSGGSPDAPCAVPNGLPCAAHCTPQRTSPSRHRSLRTATHAATPMASSAAAPTKSTVFDKISGTHPHVRNALLYTLFHSLHPIGDRGVVARILLVHANTVAMPCVDGGAGAQHNRGTVQEVCGDY